MSDSVGRAAGLRAVRGGHEPTPRPERHGQWRRLGNGDVPKWPRKGVPLAVLVDLRVRARTHPCLPAGPQSLARDLEAADSGDSPLAAPAGERLFRAARAPRP